MEETFNFGNAGDPLGNTNGWQKEFNDTAGSEVVIFDTNMNNVSPFDEQGLAVQSISSTKTAAYNIGDQTGNTIYFSYLLKYFNNGGTGAIRIRSSVGNVTHAGYENGLVNVMAHTSSVSGTTAVNTSTNYFMVGKFFCSANGRDITIEASIYDDVLDVPTSEPTFEVSDSYTYGIDKTWEWVTLSSQSANTVYDDIRVATTYAEVVNIPEPATVGLLTLSGVLVARRRR